MTVEMLQEWLTRDAATGQATPESPVFLEIWKASDLSNPEIKPARVRLSGFSAGPSGVVLSGLIED